MNKGVSFKKMVGQMKLQYDQLGQMLYEPLEYKMIKALMDAVKAFEFYKANTHPENEDKSYACQWLKKYWSD